MKYLEFLKKIIAGFKNRIEIKIASSQLKGDVISLSGNSLSRLLKAKYPNAKIYIADSEYKIPKWENFKRWIQRDDLNFKKYEPEIFDCDNYAFESFCRAHRIIGNIGYGFAFSSQPAHAFNIIVSQKNDELKVYQIEPQNDSVSNYPNDKIYLIVI